jgi:Uma2 family endonuclease
MGGIAIPPRDSRVELIDGEVVGMPPIGSAHVSLVLQLDHLLKDSVRRQALVLVQTPIVLDDYSAPQPDLVLLRPRADYYRSALARASDALLIVEVAQSSLRYDRSVKVPLYARHGVPEVWSIDAVRLDLMRFRRPVQGAYSLADKPALAAPLGVELLPAVYLHLADIFALPVSGAAPAG